MIKKIDLYIIKKFLGTFLSAIGLIIIIVVIFDISEKIEDFIDQDIPLKSIVFDYYVNFIPYFVNMFSSLFTFIAVIYFTSRMASNTEIVAILGSGISFKRLMFPYLFSALLIGLLNLYLANELIPQVNKKRLAFEKKYINRQKFNNNNNIHLQFDDSTYYYVESFDNVANMGYRFSKEVINSNGLVEKLASQIIRYDSTTKEWRLTNYTLREISGDEEKIEKGSEYILHSKLKPTDFFRDNYNVEEMTRKELKKFIETEKTRGSTKINFYEYEAAQRIIHPFACIILTMIGLSLSSQKRRGGLGAHLTVGLSLTFLFILFLQVSKVFATFGNMSVSFAAALPLLIFGLIAIILVRRAPK